MMISTALLKNFVQIAKSAIVGFLQICCLCCWGLDESGLMIICAVYYCAHEELVLSTVLLKKVCANC